MILARGGVPKWAGQVTKRSGRVISTRRNNIAKRLPESLVEGSRCALDCMFASRHDTRATRLI